MSLIEPGLVMICRLVGSDLLAWPWILGDYGQPLHKSRKGLVGLGRPVRILWPSTEISLQCNEGQQMPPASRQVDVQQERGERNPAPAASATRLELAKAAGADDVKLTEPKLLPDEQELRRIIDLIPQTIVVLGRDGKAIFANRVALEYTGLSLDEVRADNFRDRVFHPEDVQRLAKSGREVSLARFRSKTSSALGGKTVSVGGF